MGRYRAGGPTIINSHMKSAFANCSHGTSFGHELLHERLRRATRDKNKCLEPATIGRAGNSGPNAGIKTVKQSLY